MGGCCNGDLRVELWLCWLVPEETYVNLPVIISVSIRPCRLSANGRQTYDLNAEHTSHLLYKTYKTVWVCFMYCKANHSFYRQSAIMELCSRPQYYIHYGKRAEVRENLASFKNWTIARLKQSPTQRILINRYENFDWLLWSVFIYRGVQTVYRRKCQNLPH